MTDVKLTRKQVSEAYAAAIEAESCCGSPAPKGVAAKLAGYDEALLRELPADAVVNSFGCGNPVAFAGIGEGDVVLDLGSGAGIDLLLAAKKVGPNGSVIGIDMTDEMIVRARENIAAAGLSNVEVRKGIIEDLPVADASVDWVISNCVINLSPEKDKVFAEIARVLKPGGRISVSDVVAEDLPDWVRADTALYSSCIGGAISESDYVRGLRAVGLVDVGVEERMPYDSNQMEELLVSDIADASSSSCCNPASVGIRDIAEAVSGKVWSARVTATKP
ncbi:MAG TPA: arsenite methyltransferase [Acidimicrobiia bacterium]|nr:arsenite methyltransferase [Acidimicrobiia bacterium]